MRFQVGLQLRFRLLEYLTITGFVWSLYLMWLIPFMLLWVGMPWDNFIVWIRDGTILELIFAYPLTKIIVRVSPKITGYFNDK